MRTLPLMIGVLALLAAGIAGSAAKAGGAGPDLNVILSERPAATLAAYELFRDLQADDPSAGVVPYDIATPLFSDHSEKHRFLFLPPGQRATYREDGPFEFPIGAVLVKTFAYPEGATLRKVETRLLIRHRRGWTANTYVWSADGREARLSVAGAVVDVRVATDGSGVRPVRYAVPNRNQCKGCHAVDDAIAPIGPTAGHFRNLAAATPESEIDRWTRLGLLDGAPASTHASTPAPTATLDRTARAYLDINCAHCHNPRGAANTSGLDLRAAQTDPSRWGVRKRPIAAGRAAAGMAFAIDPGHPERSILLHRMESVDPGVMMPELGRTTVHAEGVELVRKWIAQMDANGRPRSN